MKNEWMRSTLESSGNVNAGAQSINELYEEVINLRQINKKLEKRMKVLEKQNLLQAQKMDFVGNAEPSRPVFNVRSRGGGTQGMSGISSGGGVGVCSTMTYYGGSGGQKGLFSRET